MPMIDMVCPYCEDECEIDPAELEDAECVECDGCGTEFAFTYVGGVFALGEELPDERPDAEIEEVGEEGDFDDESELEDDGEDAA